MRKIYGQSQNTTCVFCDKLATKKNKQGFTTCINHVNSIMPDKKCICGEWLDIKESKWGAFYVCSNCGPISLNKANEMNEQKASGRFKLNKKFRDAQSNSFNNLSSPSLSNKSCSSISDSENKKKKPKYEDRIYTMTELLQKWNKEK